MICNNTNMFSGHEIADCDRSKDVHLQNIFHMIHICKVFLVDVQILCENPAYIFCKVTIYSIGHGLLNIWTPMLILTFTL